MIDSPGCRRPAVIGPRIQRSGSPHRINDGSIMVVEGVGQHPETKQPRWRDRWAQVVSLCPDAFVEVDTGGTVIEWNPRAEEVFGWRRDQVVGRPVTETLSPPELGFSPFSEGSGPPGSDGDHRWLSLMHRTGHRVVADGVVFGIGRGSRRSIAGFLRSRALGLHAEHPWEPFTGCDTVTGPVSYTHLDVYKRQSKAPIRAPVPRVRSGSSTPLPARPSGRRPISVGSSARWSPPI